MILTVFKGSSSMDVPLLYEQIGVSKTKCPSQRKCEKGRVVPMRDRNVVFFHHSPLDSQLPIEKIRDWWINRRKWICIQPCPTAVQHESTTICRASSCTPVRRNVGEVSDQLNFHWRTQPVYTTKFAQILKKEERVKPRIARLSREVAVKDTRERLFV